MRGEQEGGMHRDHEERKTLSIWQINMNKSLNAQHAALFALRGDIDVLCIQEPYFDFNKKSRATQLWRPVYPKGHDEKEVGKTRAITLVNRRIATSAWKRVDVESTDVVGISIETAE